MIDFAFVRRSGSGKTNVWHLMVTRTRIFGTIAWLPSWGRYAFTPTINEPLNADHLEKIAAFMRLEACAAPAQRTTVPKAKERPELMPNLRALGPSLGDWVSGKQSRRLKRRRLSSVPAD